LAVVDSGNNCNARPGGIPVLPGPLLR
jgi:hypothetical protein